MCKSCSVLSVIFALFQYVTLVPEVYPRYITEYFCVTRVHNMSKELKFSLVKSFYLTFWLLYSSSLHQCNAELQNKNRHKY